jgi:inositol-hexakisphosphate 5-kinase
MSNPPRSAENAALQVPVSNAPAPVATTGTPAACPVVAAGAAPVAASPVGGGIATSPTGTAGTAGTPGILDAARSDPPASAQASPDTAGLTFPLLPPAAADSQRLPATPPQALITPPAAQALQDAVNHADQNKKQRGPAILQRQTGPSLLTQALATARGIPTQATGASTTNTVSVAATTPTSTATDTATSTLNSISPLLLDQTQLQNQRKQSSRTYSTSSSSSSTAGVASSLKSSRSSQDGAVFDAYNVPIRHGHGGALTPKGPNSPGSLSITPVTTNSTTPSAVILASNEVGLVSSPLADSSSSVTDVTAMLIQTRNPIGPSKDRGTSLERADGERWVRDGAHKVVRAHSHSTSPDGSTASTATFVDSRPSFHDMKSDESAVMEIRSQYKNRRPPEPRVSIGPEKIWSIGSGDLGIGNEDGQVEKSVTEALVGAEPNARSRKSSYSLRFFKEGLPKEDRSKRKDSKHVAQLREKLPPSREAAEETSLDVVTEAARSASAQPSPRVLEEKDAFVAELPTRAQSFPYQSLDTSSSTESARHDYFGLRKEDERHQEETQQDLKDNKPDLESISPQHTLTQSPPIDVPVGRHPTNRNQEDITESITARDHEEDDSGEEKISSALFLPHQGPKEITKHDIATAPPVQAISHRVSSRGDDYHHSWLVKADEPELEVGSLDATTLEADLQRASDLPQAIPPVSMVDGDDFAVEDEPEVKLSRPPSQYYEDHVHEHQLSIKKPLEVIELIPYKHQVGGHTTLWRFSKRAVCKQLNNRENEFYETLERHHQDLLAFLPRYAGHFFFFLWGGRGFLF